MQAHAARPQGGLRKGFFAGHVEGGPAGAGDVMGQLREQCGLTDARVAANEDERAGDDAAAKDACEFSGGNGQSRDLGGFDVGQPDRARAYAVRRTRHNWRSGSRRLERAPRLTLRAAPERARSPVAAFAAYELRARAQDD